MKLTEQAVISRSSNLFYIFENNKRYGPYCPNCYKSTKELVLLQSLDNFTWDCNKCSHMICKSTRTLNNDFCIR